MVWRVWECGVEGGIKYDIHLFILSGLCILIVYIFVYCFQFVYFICFLSSVHVFKTIVYAYMEVIRFFIILFVVFFVFLCTLHA